MSNWIAYDIYDSRSSAGAGGEAGPAGSPPRATSAGAKSRSRAGHSPTLLNVHPSLRDEVYRDFTSANRFSPFSVQNLRSSRRPRKSGPHVSAKIPAGAHGRIAAQRRKVLFQDGFRHSQPRRALGDPLRVRRVVVDHSRARTVWKCERAKRSDQILIRADRVKIDSKG